MSTVPKVKEFFLRDENRTPVALVVSKWLSDSDLMTVGVAMWNPKDKFDKNVARQVAYGRMHTNTIMFTRQFTYELGGPKAAILKFLATDNRFSTRTQRAAALWLERQNMKAALTSVISQLAHLAKTHVLDAIPRMSDGREVTD